MPLYDYVCGSCGRRTEVMHSVHASGPETCPACGQGPMKKALNPPAIHFKGTGWAKKERASSGSTKAASTRPAEPGDVGGPAGGSDSGGGSGSEAGSGSSSTGGGPGSAPAPAGGATAAGAKEG